jgi:hypothetical protein
LTGRFDGGFIPRQSADRRAFVETICLMDLNACQNRNDVAADIAGSQSVKLGGLKVALSVGIQLF